MWLQYHQSNLTELIQTALVKLCLENVPFSGNLELDGLFCISNGDISRQIVVKIHKVIQPSSSSASSRSKNRSILKINQTTVESDESSRQKEMPLVVEVRRGNVGDGIVYKSDYSSDISNGKKESGASYKKDDGILRTGNVLLVEIPSSSANSSASKDQVTAVNLSKNSHIEESPYKLSQVKEEPIQESSTCDEDSVNDSFQGQEICGTQNEMKCKHCQVNFTDLNELETHMRESHGRFVCRQCLTTFSLSCNLRRHMKLHTGVRPHVCDSCQSSFSRSTDLKIHMKKHSTGKETLSCSVCSATFNNPYLLTQHQLKAHNMTETLKCDLCEKQFSSETNLRLHRKIHEENSNSGSRGYNSVLAAEGEDEEDVGDEEMSFEDGNCSNSSECLWSSSKKSGQVTESNRSTSGKVVDDVEGDGKDDEPLDFQVKRIQNGNTENSLADISRNISDNYLETVKEFAPLFSIGDSDDAVRSNSGSLSNQKTDSCERKVLSASAKHQSLAVPSACKNKRKGMPVKHVKVSENGTYDEVTDEQMLCDDENDDVTSENVPSRSQMVDDKSFSFNNTVGDDLTLHDSMMDSKSTSYKTPVTSLFAYGKDGKMNVKAEKHDDKSTISPDVSFNNNDSENRVFTCRHGGCSTSWFGFAAYESHYVSAHCRYPCELCDQSFTSRNNRRRHANGHGNVKKHTCDKCDKLFARPDIVKEHRITHTQSYQLGRCCKCNFSCAKKTMLLSHLKRCLSADDIDHDISK